MRLFFTFLLCLVAALSGRAQERVRNVRMRVVDSAQLEIRYDLMNARPGDSVYFEVRSRQRGVLRISPEYSRGDLGTRITAGSDRRIIWNALANGYPLNEEIQAKVLVKTGLPVLAAEPSPAAPVVAVQPPAKAPAPEAVTPTPAPVVTVTEPKPVVPTPALASQPKRTNRNKPSIFSTEDPIETQPAPTVTTEPTQKSVKSRYAGPAWALVSAVAPGIGNIFVQTPKPKIGLRPLITVGCYGLLVYGFMERQKSKDEYALYEQQKNMAAGEPYYNTANNHHHAYYMATRGALVVAAADVVLTFIKGLRNSQLQKEARRYQSLTVSPGLQAGQPTALVRFSF